MQLVSFKVATGTVEHAKSVKSAPDSDEPTPPEHTALDEWYGVDGTWTVGLYEHSPSAIARVPLNIKGPEQSVELKNRAMVKVGRAEVGVRESAIATVAAGESAMMSACAARPRATVCTWTYRAAGIAFLGSDGLARSVIFCARFLARPESSVDLKYAL